MLDELEGTRWRGTKRLWLDPDAPPDVSDATVTIEGGVVRYAWSREGRAHEGRLSPADGAVEWTDSWHQPSVMRCEPASGSPALVCVVGAYAAPPGPDWRWRTVLALRPTGQLVLQMANVTPWGEEQRAVELVAERE